MPPCGVVPLCLCKCVCDSLVGMLSSLPLTLSPLSLCVMVLHVCVRVKYTVAMFWLGSSTWKTLDKGRPAHGQKHVLSFHVLTF